MRPPITCEKHGEQRRTFVCMHILQTLHDGRLHGFLWGRDEEGEYSARCTRCAQIPQEDFAAAQASLVRPLCLLCFYAAGRANGVAWKPLR